MRRFACSGANAADQCGTDCHSRAHRCSIDTACAASRGFSSTSPSTSTTCELTCARSVIVLALMYHLAQSTKRVLSICQAEWVAPHHRSWSRKRVSRRLAWTRAGTVSTVSAATISSGRRASPRVRRAISSAFSRAVACA